MFTILQTKRDRKIYLSETEKKEMKKELNALYEAGGRNLFIDLAKGRKLELFVYNDVKEKVGCLIGTSALLVAYIVGICSDNSYESYFIDIKEFIKEHLEE